MTNEMPRTDAGPALGRAEGDAVPQDRSVAPWWLLGGVAAVAVAFSLYRTVGKTTDFQDLDFGAYYRGAAAVTRGESPYFIDAEHGPTGSYVYGPAFAYLLQPLAKLDYIWAVRLWTL